MIVDWPEGVGFETRPDGFAHLGNPGPWLWAGVIATDGTPGEIDWATELVVSKAARLLSENKVPSARWQIAVKAFDRPTGQVHVHCLCRDAAASQ